MSRCWEAARLLQAMLLCASSFTSSATASVGESALQRLFSTVIVPSLPWVLRCLQDYDIKRAWPGCVIAEPYVVVRSIPYTRGQVRSLCARTKTHGSRRPRRRHQYVLLTATFRTLGARPSREGDSNAAPRRGLCFLLFFEEHALPPPATRALNRPARGLLPPSCVFLSSSPVLADVSPG